MLHEMWNGKSFCILDIHKAYLRLSVDSGSAHVQILTTHRGICQCNRLSFGINTTPNEFQKAINQILGDLQGTIAYFGYIIIYGESVEQCRQRLIAYLNRLKSKNIHLNKNASFFSEKNSVSRTHCRRRLYQEAQEKISAVVKAPRPTTMDEVPTFLGIVIYYSKFIPNASTMTYSLRALLRKNICFILTREKLFKY